MCTTPYKILLDSLPITTDRAKNLKMNETKSEEELFDILEDEQISDFDDHDKIILTITMALVSHAAPTTTTTRHPHLRKTSAF